jgi:adenylyltransferase/sulfurtransferase
VPLEDGKVLFRSFSGTVMLSGGFVSSVLAALVPQLDGSRPVEELLREVRADFQPEFEHFLRVMEEKGFLQQGSQRGAEQQMLSRTPISPGELAYWSLHTPRADEAVASLAESTVVVAGLGGVGTAVARTLAASGVGQLVLVDPQVVAPSDADGDIGRDIGRATTEALTDWLRQQGKTQVSAVPATVDSAATWDEIVSEADVIALCSDNMSLAGYSRTNDACIRLGTRWVSARIDRHWAIIGPFVIPEQSPCFTCFELRSRANADYPADHEALYRHWRNVNDCPSAWPSLAAFAEITGNFLAVDMLRVLGGKHLSAAAGRVIHLDLHTLESRTHELLKLPRCPACSRTRQHPLTRIWDVVPKPPSTTENTERS